jgi:hypothetical protein
MDPWCLSSHGGGERSRKDDGGAIVHCDREAALGGFRVEPGSAVESGPQALQRRADRSNEPFGIRCGSMPSGVRRNSSSRKAPRSAWLSAGCVMLSLAAARVAVALSGNSIKHNKQMEIQHAPVHAALRMPCCPT